MATLVGPGPILVVDDDADSRFALSSLLSLNGYDVEVAESGGQALEKLEKRDFALVIMDYVMPHMTGLDLFKRIHERWPEMKGIFLTGYLTPNSMAAALREGVAEVVAKPVGMEKLVELIER